MKPKIIKDSLILGSALFSMFFGAGNMIFPPYLGLESASEWFVGFLGYFVADIALAMVAIIAQIRTNGFESLLDPLGKVLKTFLIVSIVLCLGPVITIPRTAATTYELMPYADALGRPVFCGIFFAIVLLLCINESGVVDIVGKVLTPLLLAGLCTIIILGVANPLGKPAEFAKVSGPLASGIEAGYQSMDVLAATIFGVLILSGARKKGHSSKTDCRKVTIGASLTAGIALFGIYMGLTYLGATVSQKYSMHISKSVLLTEIVRTLLGGGYGQIFFGIVASLACLSTAIALTSSSAHFIVRLLGNRIGYKACTSAICVLSALIALMGVDRLIVFASPILNIIYPPVLTVIILSFFDNRIGKMAYIFPTIGATAISILQIIYGYGSPVLNALPFYRLGLGWLLPAVICFGAGVMADKIITATKEGK